MFQGLRTAIFKVKDLGAAKNWYSDVLGFPPYFDEPFYVGFSVGGFELGLDPAAEGVKTGDNLLVYRGAENARETFDELLKKGATAHSEPQNVGGAIVAASVYDPFGNIFGIIENPEFKLEDTK